MPQNATKATPTEKPRTPAAEPHFDVKAPEVAHYARVVTDQGDPITAARYHDGSIRIATDQQDLHLPQPQAGSISRVLQQPAG